MWLSQVALQWISTVSNRPTGVQGCLSEEHPEVLWVRVVKVLRHHRVRADPRTLEVRVLQATLLRITWSSICSITCNSSSSKRCTGPWHRLRLPALLCPVLLRECSPIPASSCWVHIRLLLSTIPAAWRHQQVLITGLSWNETGSFNEFNDY